MIGVDRNDGFHMLHSPQMLHGPRNSECQVQFATGSGLSSQAHLPALLKPAGARYRPRTGEGRSKPLGKPGKARNVLFILYPTADRHDEFALTDIHSLGGRIDEPLVGPSSS